MAFLASWRHDPAGGRTTFAYDASGRVESVTTPKSVWDATADPDANDDVTDDFYPGSLWLNVTDGLLFLCLDNATGAAEWTNVPLGAIPLSEVWVHTGNGLGSTNTNFRRYTTALVDTGTAITYADSATLGASFTINEDGIYAMELNDINTSVTSGFGIVKNAANNPPANVPIANRLAWASGNNVVVCAAVTTRLTAGDIIRVAASLSGTPGTTDASAFRIIKIGN